MKCKKCGTEFSEGIFCPMCGTKNEEVIIDQEKVAEIEKKEREQAEEIAIAEARKKVEKEKEAIRQDAEKKAREDAIRIAQEKARKNISSDDEEIKSEALKLVRDEAVQSAKREEERKQQEEADRKAKEEKKINQKAIVSLILGIASWISIPTVFLPLVLGVWAIVDGCKALKGKTKYKKSAIIGIVLPILFFILLIVGVALVVMEYKKDLQKEAQLNSYIEKGQYVEAQEYIAQEYKVGTLSYVEKCAQVCELQGMYDEAVDLWVEYCINEYEPINIPDSRINKLNEYLDKHEAELRPETIEKVYNLINSKELAKAEEQAAKAAKEAEEQAVEKAKEKEKQAAKVEKKNSSEADVKNNDTVGNSTYQTNVNKVSDTVKTWYNNGNPHTYKYEGENYYIIAELYMDDYDEYDDKSTFSIRLKRYDNGDNIETYGRDARVSLIQDEKGNDHSSNGAYYRGWDRDNGTEIFIEFNYETEYCRIRMNMPNDEKGYNFDYIFDYEYVYYPEEPDGVDDGIADLDNYSYPIDFFATYEGIVEENLGKTFRLTCYYEGIEDGYMSFYYDSPSAAGGSFSVYGKTDKDFGTFFSGDQVYLTAIWKEVGPGYEAIVDIIDLQIIN